MIMDAKKLSELIRAKKKAALSAEPELVQGDSTTSMNPSGIYDTTMQGRIEGTLKSPHKIDARDTAMSETPSESEGIGLHPDDKMRLERLRKYIDTLDLSMK